MNTRRLVVFLLAAGAAGVLALMVRGFLGGGSKTAEAHVVAPPVAVAQVLVAATRIEPGKAVMADQVRWQDWPEKNVDSTFIRKGAGQTAATIVDGTVARAPIVEGEPITYAKIVRSQGAGFMSATLSPGMRAMSIGVSVASVAGGFIQPNDRVDLMVTMVSSGETKIGITRVVVSNVRVLAIDQAAENKNQKAVSDVKTVTLELTPDQAQATSMAQAVGTLSLALRGLGDEAHVANIADGRSGRKGDASGFVTVLRYGMTRKASGGGVQ